MNTLSLVLRSLAIAGGLLAGAAWFLTQGKLDEKQQQLTTTQNQLASTRADLASAQDNILTLESDLKTARSDLAVQKQKVTQFQTQYFDATQELTRLQASLESLESQNRRLSSDNENLKKEILAVKSAPPPDVDNSEVVQGYKNRISELEEEIRELQGRLAGAPTTLPASAPANQAVPGAVFQLTATVAAIQAENGLIVFNRGASAGLQAMREYALHKNGTELGRIRVTALEPDASVGSILAGANFSNQLRTGDTILIVQ